MTRINVFQGLWHILLMAGLGGLPLLLVTLTLVSGMSHSAWFYVILLLIPASGLAATVYLGRDKSDRANSPNRPGAQRKPERVPNQARYSVLISVALPSSGASFLRIARTLAPPEQLDLAALHLWPEEQFRAEAYQRQETCEAPEPLRPLLEAAGELQVEPLCLVSADVGADITAVAEERQADLILMGWHGPVSREADAPGPVHTVLQQARADVGVYLARHFRPLWRVLVPYFGGLHDRAALELARRMSSNGAVKVTILHVVPPERAADAPRSGLSKMVQDPLTRRVHLKIVEHEDPVEAAVREAWVGYDLIVVGASEVWGLELSPFTTRHERLAFATPTSLLVLRKYLPVSVGEAIHPHQTPAASVPR